MAGRGTGGVVDNDDGDVDDAIVTVAVELATLLFDAVVVGKGGGAFLALTTA